MLIVFNHETYQELLKDNRNKYLVTKPCFFTMGRWQTTYLSSRPAASFIHFLIWMLTSITFNSAHLVSHSSAFIKYKPFNTQYWYVGTLISLINVGLQITVGSGKNI